MRVSGSPGVGVGGHVGVEVGGVAEGLVAHGALVGRGRAVRGLVLLEVGLLAELLVAHAAREWPLACRRYFRISLVSLREREVKGGLPE